MESPLIQRITELMAERNLTRSAFADSIGLDPSKMTRSMNGERRFTLTDLSMIAEIYDASLDWLMGKDRGRIAARRSVSVPVDKLVARGKAYAVQRDDLTHLGMDTRWKAPDRNYASSARTAVQQGNQWGEAAAEAFQHAHGSILKVSNIRLMDQIERIFGADVAVVPDTTGVDGVAIAQKNAKVIALASSTNPARQRFTLAHELCHLIVDDDQSVLLDEDVLKTNSIPSEIRAGAFAAAFLMPHKVVADRLGPVGSQVSDEDALSLAFDLGVSPASLAFRLLNLGYIDDIRRAGLGKHRFQDAATSAGTLSEFAIAVEEAKSARLPKQLISDTFSAYLQGLTTLKPYANLIGSTVEAVRDSIDDTFPMK